MTWQNGIALLDNPCELRSSKEKKKMVGSSFGHFLLLSYTPPSSLSTLFPTKTLTLSSSPFRCKCFFKNMKASGIRQVGLTTLHGHRVDAMKSSIVLKMFQREMTIESHNTLVTKQSEMNDFTTEDLEDGGLLSKLVYTFLFGQTLSVVSPGLSYASDSMKMNQIYEVGELFDLSIQLLYLVSLLGLLGVGTYFVIRQVLVRRELDLSAKELQEQVRSGDASATELFELGAVMLRRKFYPAATKFLLQAIEKWDGDKQDLAQVYNALGVSYVRDGKVDKGIAQFEMAVKLQPGYVTAWNNLGDAFENKKEYKAALKAFEEVLLFDPNNKIARPRRDALKDRVEMYKGVPVKSKEK
ncbi:uncharacterized protein DS421_9g285640 [Arachis hypogaea]|nr:uncharacterized protein DS421_9g285640 [Arachis hypogaea]